MHQRYSDWLKLFRDHIADIGVEEHVRRDEGYKFANIDQFQRNFNIEAENLVASLEAAINNDNLVAGAMYFPRRMLLQYAEMFPEETRAALRALFDESQDVAERINSTIKSFDEINERRNAVVETLANHTYISLRFISLLLGYRYPDNYNPLKPAEWKVFAKFIEPDFVMPHKTTAGEQYKIYSKYANQLRDIVMDQPDMDKLRLALTANLNFKDDGWRWLTQDVIFVTARQYAQQQANDSAAAQPMSENELEEGTTEYLEDEVYGLMPYELHLEEYIMKNWDQIDFGEKLHVYIDEAGANGQQYTTDVGILDILVQDENDNFVVIELKRAESGYAVVGQILNYMSWVQDNLAQDGQSVRGIIVVGKADAKLRAAHKMVASTVELKEYRMSLKLTKPE